MAYKVKKKIPELTLPPVPGDPGISPSEMYVLLPNRLVNFLEIWYYKEISGYFRKILEISRKISNIFRSVLINENIYIQLKCSASV